MTETKDNKINDNAETTFTANTSKKEMLTGFLVLFLCVSVGLNLYWWQENKKLRGGANFFEEKFSSETMHWDDSKNAEHGVKSISWSNCQNGKCESFATTTPLTEIEIKEMYQKFQEQEKLLRERIRKMEEYFERHEKLMREFWSF